MRLLLEFGEPGRKFVHIFFVVFDCRRMKFDVIDRRRDKKVSFQMGDFFVKNAATLAEFFVGHKPLDT
ncbi:hypothetical protein [Brucella anthropi]|uniref:hypothetical protein n=1 Tax=Brucella anthropi TaxID=529 RepID=UPI001F2D8D5A|nr:hypothetical protein [Brucella anthropi]